MGFELQDGIFKKFVARARKNYEDSQKSKETIEKEISVQESMMDFFSGIELGVDTFKTINGNEFTITSVDDKHVNISIPGNETVNKLSLNVDEIRRMLESDVKFTKIKDVTAFFGKAFATQAYSYDFAIYKAIKAKKGASSKAKSKTTELKKYIFIDLKSYYASVECVHRGLDPLKANLLVADESRSDQTICLAVSPSLKAKGVPGRPRLFEAKQKIREYEIRCHTKVDYIIAVPRMAEYERISAQIYSIYLRYVAPEDIHVYSMILLVFRLLDSRSSIQNRNKRCSWIYEIS